MTISDGIRTFENFIDGARPPALGGRWIESIEPAVNRGWARVPDSDEPDSDRAVQAARRAFHGEWSRYPAVQRSGLLRRLAGLFAEHARELAEIESRDNGRVFAEIV